MKRAIAAVALLAIVGAAAYFYLGLYNVAADEKHWAMTEALLQTVKVRSVAARARAIGDVPDLTDRKLISAGAGQYAEMCVQCHLAPGKKDSPLRQGLYPQPPDLSLQSPEPRVAFWIVKHGIKLTGMPAWGASHDDATIWSLVAFLQKLPGLDEKAYRKMIATAPADESMRGMPGMKDMPMGGAKSDGAAGHRDVQPHGQGK